MDLTEHMLQLAKRSKSAAHRLTQLDTAQKNRCLEAMAEALIDHQTEIQEANAKDLDTAKAMQLSKAMTDRLILDASRIAGMAQGLREIAALPDPVGRELDRKERPNGLILRKMATPIGVIVIIYESRPNVTADAAGLCFKSGNATILRGGKEAIHSNQIIAKLMVEAAQKCEQNFPADAIQVIPTTDRAAVPALLSLTDYVDLCMPRGGEGLIRAVADCSKVPVIKHYKGVCHVHVDKEADLEMAIQIAVNSKTQRPGVCNAMETLLVDRSIVQDLLPKLAMELAAKGVTVKGDQTVNSILTPLVTAESLDIQLENASEEDWHAEYLDLILAIRVVDDLNQAIDHINTYGSGHSDCIVTKNETTANRFMRDVDASAVYWNASTRFTDGAEFGMGAEIGISTDKIGARGPMGLEELTSYKWLCFGSGQIR
ncbi:MAG: glutamate-5-semialdehyde dehydrogenase [Verrucomicrobia bacterium]|nr:glutamate-5-semialdehyde dehydrogenase [Verrucomicrobiota bacterium]